MTRVTDRTRDPIPAPGGSPAAPAGLTAIRAALAGLRPQPFAYGNPARVDDPLIEPQWTGIRALAAIDEDGATLSDEAGDPIDEHADVAALLAEAARADQLIVDGFLTTLAMRGPGVYVPMDDLPSARAMAGRSFFGIRRSRPERVLQGREVAPPAPVFGPDDTVVFVAIDLLWLDDESLIDVPLLERRRLLESALTESERVRRGVYVRPPVDAWIGSWRSLGFVGLTFRAANGRYSPTLPGEDWISAPMPRR
jgi:ATP-dependent DNA ligase